MAIIHYFVSFIICVVSGWSVPAAEKKETSPKGSPTNGIIRFAKTVISSVPEGCLDKVTEKYPGKCDPIIHYENKKRGLEK